MILRPSGVVATDGHLELGLEVELDGRRIADIRPHTGLPDPYVLSGAFTNSHSHLEYRGMLGRIQSPDYWGFLREITLLKREETRDDVMDACLTAAMENRMTGVARVAEHSDRPFAGAALKAAGLDGVLFQEVITFLEADAPDNKLAECVRRAHDQELHSGFPVFVSPHTGFTVDAATLARLAAGGTPLSVHLSETTAEEALFREGTGPIAEFFLDHGFVQPEPGRSATEWLGHVGMLRQGVQLVHCCAVDDHDIELIAKAGCTVAHCPRSNVRLQCPTAPVRRMVASGIAVGLGTDSAASGGPIDLFDEMRSALASSLAMGEPLTAEQVWSMATASEVPGVQPLPPLAKGAETPLIAIHVEGARSTADVIRDGTPDRVEWIVR